jgi:hypothetical protein
MHRTVLGLSTVLTKIRDAVARRKSSGSRVGTIVLNMKDLAADKAATPAWWSVYSAPLSKHVTLLQGITSSDVTRMQRMPEIASTYNGRVQLAVRIIGKQKQKGENPSGSAAAISHVRPLVVAKDDPGFLSAAALTLPRVRYRLRALILAAESIPECWPETRTRLRSSGGDDVAVAVCMGNSPPQVISLAAVVARVSGLHAIARSRTSLICSLPPSYRLMTEASGGASYFRCGMPVDPCASGRNCAFHFVPTLHSFRSRMCIYRRT